MNCRPRVIPVAQAPPSVVYVPAQNNCPYPIGPPSGHPAMPPLPLLTTRLHHDHTRARSVPELCENSATSHVLSYDRRRSGRPHSRSNVSLDRNSHIRYTPTPISMPFPETILDRRVEYPEHRNYPPEPPPRTSSQLPSDTQLYPPEPPRRTASQLRSDTQLYPPEAPPRTTSQLPSDAQLQVDDRHFMRSMTLPSNYRTRTAPSAPLAAEEDFRLADGNINHELPPPSYDDVMREIRHERARSMISRR
ncbi:unnamed protein product [Diabrotica balteata]|uniref:Uncharacterized protein n=1 Tax=Diabrotica balteata TaxID=107213 RepID=A0A9N9SUP7_DIABA|nr:unnamed protein product [Diabrotica balteata]